MSYKSSLGETWEALKRTPFLSYFVQPVVGGGWCPSVTFLVLVTKPSSLCFPKNVPLSLLLFGRKLPTNQKRAPNAQCTTKKPMPK